MSDSVFNSPDKRKRTLQKTAEYFKTDDRPITGRISEAIGGLFSSDTDTETRKRKLAESMAKSMKASQAGE